MSKFTHGAPAHFTRPRLFEAVAEVVITLATAGFTAAIWLSIAGGAIAPVGAGRPVAAAHPSAAQHVTLPTVVIVGRQESVEDTPATTTAQNTPSNPITLRQ